MKNGFDVGGFDAYVTTQVIPSAGVSSSASYEMLICAIINFMFNDNKMTENDCAKAGSTRKMSSGISRQALWTR